MPVDRASRILLLAAAAVSSAACGAQAKAPTAAASKGAIGEQGQPRPMLFFDWNSAALTGEAKATLDAVTKQITVDSQVLLVGHSDRSGSTLSSRAIAGRRAETARDYLSAHGVNIERIAVRDDADRNPLIRTADGVREAQNRRVDVIIR